MSAPAPIFVDSGAWIALALTRDPHHEAAVASWDALLGQGARLATSVPVVLETFTFLERTTSRATAIRWKDTLGEVPRLRIVECTRADLAACWRWFERNELHKLSAVDATSFAIMTRERMRVAFTFDHHFLAVGFRAVG
ncbi:MAG: PIN domain-containing protein [Deltaproteobacteria bacterium]|nr:PIN domain-containing protein [Deltaproteobacteria bacterium]